MHNSLEDHNVKSGEVYLSLANDAAVPGTPECMVCLRSQSFTPVISTYAGEQWRLVSEGIFTHALPAGASSPDDPPFRIRLAIYPSQANDLLRAVVPTVVAAGCPFKIISNAALLELAFARTSSPDAAADFMGIYPPSEELFNDLTEKIQATIQEIKSSYIPTPPLEKTSRTALAAENPWPGLDFYWPGEQAFFYGREEEQLALAQQLERGPVTVLTSPPGAGKSSLVRAGLAAIFARAGFTPVYLHLQCAGASHPLQQVRDEINRVLREARIEGAPFGEGQSLREYFYQPEPIWVAAGQKPVVPVLIFDQFEDVLTSNGAEPAAARQLEAFWNQLANLVENRAPQTIGQLNRSNVRAERLGCKVIISLRQEFLPQLLARAGQNPSLARNHFFLKPFRGSKAFEAVLGPGRSLLDPNSPDILAKAIVRRVARETPQSSECPIAEGEISEALDHLQIEPALLCFFCHQLNEARKNSPNAAAGNNYIMAGLVETESARIFEDFFQRTGEASVATPVTKHQTEERKQHEAAIETIVIAPAPELPQQEAPLEQMQKENTALEECREKETGEFLETQAKVASTESEPALSQPQTTVAETRQQEVEATLTAPMPEVSEKEPLPTRPLLELHQESSEEKKPAPAAAPRNPSIDALMARLELEDRLREKQAKIAAEKAARAQAPAPPPQVPAPEPSPWPKPAGPEGQLARGKRLRFLVYGLGLLVTAIFAVLIVLYIQEIQKQQTEVELEELISNVAAANRTFKAAKENLTHAESDLALKESDIKALSKKSREQEAEAQSAKEQYVRMASEQTNYYESQITQLNREKTQEEARLAHLGGLLNDLTNQLANLSRQKQTSQSSNRVVTVTNRVTVTNYVENNSPAPSAVKGSQEAEAMEKFPLELPASAVDSSHRSVDVLLINGQCLASDDGAKFHALRLHDQLYEGAVIMTDPLSWCDLFIRRTGTTVRMAPESRMKITKLSEASENGVPVIDTVLQLDSGRVFTAVRALSPGSTLEISDTARHSVIAGGGLGCYMITAPGSNGADKLVLTPLRVVGQIGTSIVAPGQSYNAKDSAALSLVPSSWETMLIQLDELEAETDRAIAEPLHPGPTTKK